MSKNAFSIQNEALLVGCFYKNPEFFVEYNTVMRSEYDFYKTDDEIKNKEVGEMQFWYDNFENMYLNFSQDFLENKVNMYMSLEESRYGRYKRLGGYNTLRKFMDMADASDFKKYFSTVKKYAFLREMKLMGFSIDKMLEHKQFDSFTADYIQKALLQKIHSMKTVIGGIEESVKLGKTASSSVAGWTKRPSYGVDLPFHLWNLSFRGARKKKFLVEAMLSNEGKTRKMMMIATYMAVETGSPMLIMTNEMSEEDILSCKITTVLNLPEVMSRFDFKLDKTENEIVMGLYRSNSDGNFLQRQFDDWGEPRMSDEDWENFLQENSDEYKNVLEVARWIEDNTTMYFMEMNGKYSDADIEMQIKSHVLAHKIEYVFYDTLKGFKTDGWEAIKQSATRLEELMKELNIFGYANFQLTDDSVFIDIFDFTSMNLANCKQMFHVLDFLCLNKRLFPDEYDKYVIEDNYGGEIPLAYDKTYYGCKIGKSRTGNKGKVTAMEVDLDRNTWVEIGWLKKKSGLSGSSPTRFKK